MKSVDIETVINQFTESNSRSVLIDGPWGCGKTYQVKQYLKKNKKLRRKRKKVYYISLFGKETIDEINTELYKEVKPGLFTTRKVSSYGFSLVSKVFVPIPAVSCFSGLAESIGFAINDIGSKNISGNKIVIFDDLERIDENLSYISLLGYMYSLFRSKIRIICLASSENIKGVRKEEFDDFKEKIFDKVHVINESDIEIVSTYFSNNYKGDMSLIVDEFENNLRLAQKTALFYDEILKHSSKNDFKLNERISDLNLLRSCNQVIKICFNKSDKPTFKEVSSGNVDFELLSYEEDALVFGESIANGLHKYLKMENKVEKDPVLQSYSEGIIHSLINIFLYRNYNDFNKIFKNENYNKDDILDSNLFLLSDKHKNEYINEFFRRLEEGKLIFDSTNVKKFSEIIYYNNQEFSDDEIEKIVRLIYKNAPVDNTKTISTFTKTLLERIQLNFGRKGESSYQKWVQIINSVQQELETDEAIKILSIIKSENDHTGMSEYIDTLTTKIHLSENVINMDEVIHFIVDNDFLLPNLSGDITADEWSFSHSITKFALESGKDKEFFDMAVKTCKEDTNNNSLISRFESLIFQKLKNKYNLKKELENK